MRFANNVVTSTCLSIVMFGTGVCLSSDILASGIPFAGNRPQSFQFSSEFTESYDSFGQYLQWNNDRRRFDDDGDEVRGSGTDTYVGLSSLLHYWKVDGLPKNGFVASITVPEIAIRGSNTRVSGIGDPLIGGLVWYNPVPSRTLGVQAYVQVPLGADSVSSDGYSLWPSVFYNEWFGRVNIDLLLGGILRDEAAHGVEPGDTAHANLRLGYNLVDRPTYQITPFLSYDYQKSWESEDRAGQPIAHSESNETALGAGVLFQLKPGIQSLYAQKMWDQVSLHYSTGVQGRNTSVTDGLFLQVWHYW